MNYGRVPREPAESVCDEEDRIRFVPTFDFTLIGHEKGSVEYKRCVESHMSAVQNQCRELCRDHSWEKVSERYGVTCENLKTSGTNIPIVRHTCIVEFPAELVFLICHAITYSSVVDPYAFHVECKDPVDTDKYDWAHVTWTVDNIYPCFALRDFCTLDFVDSEEMMIFSKSVEHPLVPRTAVPSKTSGFKRKTLKSRTYRTPLFWFISVAPLDEKRCILTQVQWSDVGGVIPEERIIQEVEKFGYLSTMRFRKIVSDVWERGLSIPKIKDLIILRWERDVDKIIPGLDKSY